MTGAVVDPYRSPPARRGGGLPEPARVLPFRPRERVRRLRRSPLVRLAGLALGAALVVGLPAAAAGWVATSPRFALRHVDLEVGERVGREWALAQLAPAEGRNLLRLPLDRLAERLESHPWVASVELTKELPDRLRVTLHERRVAALLRHDGELWYLDSEGLVVAPFDPLAPPEDLLLVSRRETEGDVGAPGEPVLGLAPLSDALAFAAEVERVRPAWAAQLSEIEIVGEQDFRLFTSAVPFPVLARAGSLAEKVARLEPLLGEIVARYPAVAAVDLRFRRHIVVQPSPRGRASSRNA